MRTKIIKIKGDWEEVVNDCRTTVGKEPLGKEPSKDFKRRILLSEHSPIRDISFKWMWVLKSWVSVHWVRHKWEKFVRTQRTDRTGVNRDELRQDELVEMTGEANTQALIDTMRKRLCYQASDETREYAEDLKRAIHECEPEISDVLVPNCVYRCGCPEMTGCPVGHWGEFFAWCKKNDLPDPRTVSVQRRYDLYNQFFWGAWGDQ